MKKHDTLATRLSLILTKLNNGERFTVDELSHEFNVTKRTIQRDLKERFIGIPLKREKGFYFMFPSFGTEFSQHLLAKNVSKAYLIKIHNFEDIGHKIEDFKSIEGAI